MGWMLLLLSEKETRTGCMSLLVDLPAICTVLFWCPLMMLKCADGFREPSPKPGLPLLIVRGSPDVPFAGGPGE